MIYFVKQVTWHFMKVLWSLQSPWKKVSIFCMNIFFLNLRRTRQKKAKSQRGFESMTLHYLVRCSNHWATGDYDKQGSICGSQLESYHTATLFPGPCPYLECGAGKGPGIGWSRAHLNIHKNTNVWIPVVNSAFWLVDKIFLDLNILGKVRV